jgi:eukaryotic-like serine/threonine-protein kinase
MSDTTTIPEERIGDLLFGGDERGIDADAMRARMANRLFGVDFEPVRIGRFELLERLGAGSMGVVCAAFDPSLGRKVAIKVLSPDRGGAEYRARMLEEAKTLARLSHPNVVTVHEVDELENDIFIVMEYIEGTTLEYWQREDRSLRETLLVYAQAAAGLCAAHAVGVVHRDFKPANALVGADGRVRVVDFGLARGNRAAVPRGHDPTVTTRGGTPAYMSPEQAVGRRVDERSDQFSFCVALWEAVHGRRPYDAEQIHALGTDRTQRIEPNAGPRRVPAWLRRILRRGLHPDAEHRWPSMDALRAALSSGGRRRTQAAIGAVFAVGLGGVGLASVMAPPPCPPPSGRFVGVWDAPTRAEIEQAMLQTDLPFAETSWQSVATRIDTYVKQWKRAHVDQCSADHAQGRREEARSQAFAACLERRHDALASMVELLSRGERDIVVAAPTLAASLPRISDCTHDEFLLPDGDEIDPDRLAASTAVMREVEHLRQLLRIGRVHEAQEIAQAAVEQAQTLEDGPTLAAARLARGLTRRAQGDVAGAEEDLLAAALAAETKRSDWLAAEAWRTLVLLGATDLEDVGRATTWAGLAQVALAKMGEPAAERAQLLVALGRLEELRGNDARAQTHYADALALQATIGGPDDATPATAIRYLANSLASSGDSHGALEHYERARTLITDVHGPSHPDTAHLDFNIALTLVGSDVDAAVERAESALATFTRVYGPSSLRTAPAQVFLAQVAFARGDFERGEQLAQLAWSIQKRELPVGHVERGMAMAVLANAYITAERWAEALQASEILLEEFATGPNRATLPELQQNAGWLLCQLQRCEEARPYFERALLESSHGSRLATKAELGLANVDLAQGLPGLARERLVRLLVLAEEFSETDRELLAEIHFTTARALLATRQERGTALQHAHRARTVYQELGNRPSIVAALDQLIDQLRKR